MLEIKSPIGNRTIIEFANATVHGIRWMRENVEQFSSVAYAPDGGKPTLAPNNWGQLFYIAVNK
jgi:hypothetical protein